MSWKMKLTKEEAYHLYYDEEKSLAEIGKLAGVTRQRMSQLMEEWGYPRRTSGWKKHKMKFTDLNEYLEHSRKTGKQSYAILIKFIKPLMQKCEDCGSEIKLRIKCFKHPVTSSADFKILCSACLFSSCRKGINGFKVKKICSGYERGEKVKSLAKKYGVSAGMIYHILRENLTKIKP